MPQKFKSVFECHREPVRFRASQDVFEAVNSRIACRHYPADFVLQPKDLILGECCRLGPMPIKGNFSMAFIMDAVVFDGGAPECP